MPGKWTSRIPAVKRAIRREAQNRLGLGTDGLREHLKAELSSGALPIQSDTGALAESLFIQTPRGSDYDLRLGAAALRYLNDTGRWFVPVREHVDPGAYEKAHFGERVAQEEALPDMGGAPRTVLATMLGYGLWWQQGHWNWLTQQEEAPRDWFVGPALAWSRRELAAYFRDLIR